MSWYIICDGYATPRRHTPASPAGFGVSNTFCGYTTFTQGLHPVLGYFTPSGFVTLCRGGVCNVFEWRYFVGTHLGVSGFVCRYVRTTVFPHVGGRTKVRPYIIIVGEYRYLFVMRYY